MTNSRWREEFIARMSREGLPLDLIRAVLRSAATLDRLAVAQCNGDWPADNGARSTLVCQRCETCWAYSTLVKSWSEPKTTDTGVVIRERILICPDCRAQELITAKLAGSGWAPVFGGDPRGCVLKLARVAICRCPTSANPAWDSADCPLHGEHETHYPSRWYQDTQNGRAESRGDVIGVPA